VKAHSHESHSLRTSDHDHATPACSRGSVDTRVALPMMEASSNDTASPARTLEERETVGADAIRYPATTGVDPCERN
jgi:hypothetical protein